MLKASPECVRILEGDLFRLNERFDEWRAVIAMRARDFEASFLALEAVTLLDIRAVSGEAPGKPFLDAYDSWSRKRSAFGTDGQPDSRYDTSFTVNVMPRHGSRELVGIIQSARPEWIAEFKALPWVQPMDPDALREDIAEEDWENWRMTYSSGDAAERPVQRRGFVFDCRQDPVSLRVERLMPFLPDFESRCARMGKDIEYKRWLSGRNTAEESRNLMSSVLGFVEWCITEDGRAQLASTSRLVGRKLQHEITTELLLGHKPYGRDWVEEDVSSTYREGMSA